MTKEDPISPTLSNIIVDAVVRAILWEICGLQNDQNGFGWSAGEHNICFYANYRRIAGQYPILVQTYLTTMVRMFERSGLQTNLNETKVMICTSGLIRGQQVPEAYKQRATGEIPNFLERKRTRVSCEECGETMATSSLQHHMERTYDKLFPQLRSVDVRGGGLEVYKVSFPWILKSVDCLVEGCPDKAKSPGRLRENLCFVIINQMWPSCRRHWNRYRGVISARCICRRT